MSSSARYAAILVGGSGTRFWPMSRQAHPKPFLPLAGDESLLLQTLRRFDGWIPRENLLLVIGASQLEALRSSGHGLPEKNILVEPEGRDTAAALGLACLEVASRDAKGAIGIFACDHWVEPVNVFKEDLQAAYFHAEKSDDIVTVGIAADRPATGYGYIHRGNALPGDGSAKAFQVRAFKEKPDLATAKSYVASGEYYFNCSMFIGRVETLQKAFSANADDIWQGLIRYRNASDANRAAECYGGIRKTSFDYAVMEKTASVAVVESRFKWDDVGSWDAWDRLREPDAAGNRVDGEALIHDCGGVSVSSVDGRLLVVAGAKDLLVVQTEDATLVCPKSEIANMKALVERLRRVGKEKYL